jgi:hypothetical protein
LVEVCKVFVRSLQGFYKEFVRSSKDFARSLLGV